MRRRIAAGSVFRKSYKDRHGRTRKTRTWFLKYHLNREPVEIASGTSDYDEALALLREKMAAATKKSYSYTEDPDKVTVNQLLDLVVEDYRESKRSTTDDTQKRIDKHLRPLFRQKRATDVGTKLLKDYRRMRDASGDAEATINKELTWLRRGSNWVHDTNRSSWRASYFPITDPDNVREGVVPHENIDISEIPCLHTHAYHSLSPITRCQEGRNPKDPARHD
jgi:hypothetical protein